MVSSAGCHAAARPCQKSLHTTPWGDLAVMGSTTAPQSKNINILTHLLLLHAWPSPYINGTNTHAQGPINECFKIARTQHPQHILWNPTLFHREDTISPGHHSLSMLPCFPKHPLFFYPGLIKLFLEISKYKLNLLNGITHFWGQLYSLNKLFSCTQKEQETFCYHWFSFILQFCYTYCTITAFFNKFLIAMPSFLYQVWIST